MSSFPRVLVFRIGALGDTLVSIPALYAIRRYFGSNAHICLLRNRESHDLVVPDDILSPHSCVDTFVEYPSKGGRLSQVAGRIRLVRALRKLKFDAVVYLVPAQRDAWSVIRDRIFFRISGIRSLIGFQVFKKEELFPRGQDGKPATVKSEALFILDRLRTDGIQASEKDQLSQRGLELTDAEKKDALKWLRERGWDGSAPLIAIAPGSKHPINRWPVERFAEVGERVSRLLHCQMVVVGGPKEQSLGAELLKIWGHGINAAGAFGPRGTAAVLEQCRMLIGLDTGTTHLAAAVGIPCVGLYSAKDNPGRWHPLGDMHEVLRKDAEVACAGCMLPECPKPICSCMDLIKVDEVIKAVTRILGLLSA